MANTVYLDRVVTRLASFLKGTSWKVITRMDVTKAMRSATGDPRTHVKTAIAEQIQQALLQKEAIVCQPPLHYTRDMNDNILLVRVGSTLAGVADSLMHPTSSKVRKLVGVIGRRR